MKRFKCVKMVIIITYVITNEKIMKPIMQGGPRCFPVIAYIVNVGKRESTAAHP